MWRLEYVLVWIFRRLSVHRDFLTRTFPEDVRKFLQDAESLEVYSLAGITEGDITSLEGEGVLGSVIINNPRIQRKLIDRILLANRYNMGGMMCAGAEYGLSVKSGEAVMSFTFCFGCGQVWVAGPKGYIGVYPTAGFPVPLLKRILKGAGIPLPPPSLH